MSIPELSHIESMSHAEIQTALFNAVSSLLPAQAELFSYTAQTFVTVTTESLFYTAFPFYGLKSWLPHVIYCRGISNERREDGQCFASLKDHRFQYELSSTSQNEHIAYAKVWLKAFQLGYIVKNSFYRSRDCHYPAENAYTEAFHNPNLPNDLKRETADPRLLLAHVTPPTQSVTSPVVFVQTVTSSPQSVTEKAPAPTTVTLTDVTLCPCGCGVTLVGRQKAASTACRKRLSRAKAAA